MTTSRAFAFGLLCGKLTLDLAGAIAAADTRLGKEVRRKLLAKYTLDRLLRTETEVSEEINRRVRTKVTS